MPHYKFTFSTDYPLGTEVTANLEDALEQEVRDNLDELPGAVFGFGLEVDDE